MVRTEKILTLGDFLKRYKGRGFKVLRVTAPPPAIVVKVGGEKLLVRVK